MKNWGKLVEKSVRKAVGRVKHLEWYEETKLSYRDLCAIEFSTRADGKGRKTFVTKKSRRLTMDCHENQPFLLCHCDHVSDNWHRLSIELWHWVSSYTSATLEIFGPSRGSARIDELADWNWWILLSSIDCLLTLFRTYSRICLSLWYYVARTSKRFIEQLSTSKDHKEAIKNTWRFCPTFHKPTRESIKFSFLKIGNVPMQGKGGETSVCDFHATVNASWWRCGFSAV